MSESWLILESSGRVAKIGLARDAAVIRTAKLDDTRRHVRDLSQTVGAMLAAESLTPQQLTGVIVSCGPGSYTGLRVGLISAKALAYAVGCKLIVVETFAAIALQAPAEASHVWVIADALQGLVYVQKFARTADQWQAEDELRIVALDEGLRGANRVTWISGPGVNVYAPRLPHEFPLVPEVDREARIESVFQAGIGKHSITRAELFALEPLYLRGSSAEEKLKHG